MLLHHVLRNALMPVVTVLALHLGTLLGGTVLVEYVFNYPGLSGLLVEAVNARDYPEVQGVVLVISVLFVALNLAVDLLYAVLDPRVRHAKGSSFVAVPRRGVGPAHGRKWLRRIAILGVAAIAARTGGAVSAAGESAAHGHRASSGPAVLAHPLGQDEFGRDVLSRLLWGARTSLAWPAGPPRSPARRRAAGAGRGLLARRAELLALRSMDIVLCFPPLLLALLMVTLLGPGAATLIPVLAVLYLPGFVRVVYAGVLSVRAQDYVEAARAWAPGPAASCCAPSCPMSPARCWCSSAWPPPPPWCWNRGCRSSVSAWCRRRRPGG